MWGWGEALFTLYRFFVCIHRDEGKGFAVAKVHGEQSVGRRDSYFHVFSFKGSVVVSGGMGRKFYPFKRWYSVSHKVLIRAGAEFSSALWRYSVMVLRSI